MTLESGQEADSERKGPRTESKEECHRGGMELLGSSDGQAVWVQIWLCRRNMGLALLAQFVQLLDREGEDIEPPSVRSEFQ